MSVIIIRVSYWLKNSKETGEFVAINQGNLMKLSITTYLLRKKVLAIIKGIKQLQFFLFLFIIKTYYKISLGLLRWMEGEIQDLQITRWVESLSRFKFEVWHIKGESNTVVDFLSKPITIFSMASSRTLPIGWYMESFPFIYNLLTFILALPLDIKEHIFEKVVNYHKYLESSDNMTWCLWLLSRKLEFKPTITGKGSPWLLKPFFEKYHMNEIVFRVCTTFYHVIDEDSRWGLYLIWEASCLAYYAFW